MKRLFTLLAAMAIIAAPTAKGEAPQYRNEINVGYGQVTIMDVAHVFADAFANIFTAGYSRFDNFQSYGSVNAEYYRALGGVISVGGAFSWCGGSADVINNEDVKTGVSKYSGVSIMPAAKFYWFRKPHVAMYSKAAAGLMLLKDYDDEEAKAKGYEPWFMAQLSFVSVQFGGERLRGYLELGGGVQGFATIGVNYAF